MASSDRAVHVERGGFQRHHLRLQAAGRQQIDEQVRRAAYQIIGGKGATYYGIGSAVARLLVILHDQRAVLTISCRIETVPDFAGVTFSLPHLVYGGGALSPIAPPLDDSERAGLARSAGVLREAIGSLRIAAGV